MLWLLYAVCDVSPVPRGVYIAELLTNAVGLLLVLWGTGTDELVRLLKTRVTGNALPANGLLMLVVLTNLMVTTHNDGKIGSQQCLGRGMLSRHRPPAGQQARCSQSRMR